MQGKCWSCFWIRTLVAVLYAGVFWAVRPFLSTDDLFALVSGCLFAASLGVVVAYAAGAWRVMFLRYLRPAGLLVLGIMVAWNRNVFSGAWSWALRYFDHPAWMETNSIPAFLLWILTGAAMLHFFSGGSVDENGDIVPSRALRLAGGLVAAIVAISSLLIYASGSADIRLGHSITDILHSQGGRR